MKFPLAKPGVGSALAPDPRPARKPAHRKRWPDGMAYFVVLLFAGSTSIAQSSSGSGPQPPPLTVSAAPAPGGPWKEFPTRLVTTLPNYMPRRDGERSRFGGNKAQQLTATGFFRVEKRGARWWLVDPEGHPFVHVGIVSVALQTTSTAITTAMQEKFGSVPRWADAAAELLHSHGFNGVGAWSNSAALRAAAPPLVTTRMWNFMGAYGDRRGGTYQEAGHKGYPKGCIFVFDPEFPAFCDDYARRLVDTKDDPWLLGHFSDNELPLRKETLENFLTLPENDPGRKAAAAWLAQRRASAGAPDSAAAPIDDATRREFLGFVIERYLQITTAAIRKHDPNHLCLGPRFHGYELDAAPVFAAAGRHLDVIAINYYRAWSPDRGRMQRWAERSGRPFLITEWYAKGMDSGYPNKSGAGWTVKTQEDRGRFYQNFALGLLESQACVGWHWFKYLDNDPADLSTDPSNRDSNKGIVTLAFAPYAPLLAAMGELNQQVYALADYFDREKK